MEHELETLPDPAAVAAAGAEFVAELARDAVAADGVFRFAVSGGHTPWAMFAELTQQQVPWDSVVIYQVDERVAPPDDPDRNLAHLRQALGPAPAQVWPMPVNDSDLGAAAADYAAALPGEFHLVHLGLGPDGHTASLFPGSPALDADEGRLVVMNEDPRGNNPHPRMTLTFSAIARSRLVLVTASGEGRREALSAVCNGEDVPAARIRAERVVWLADHEAAADL